MTTAVSFPLTETAVCPEPEMALNAYSDKLKWSDSVNGIEIQILMIDPHQLDKADPLSGEKTVRYLN